MNKFIPQEHEAHSASEPLDKRGVESTATAVEKAHSPSEELIASRAISSNSSTWGWADRIPRLLKRIRGLMGGAVASPRGWLEWMDKFTLVGWAATANGDPVGLQVRIDGKAIECNIVRQHRQDVVDALGTTNPDVGFEIELPGSVWEKLPEQGGRLELLGNGEPLTPDPIVLTRAAAIGWIADIIRMEECPKKQYFHHLALQHIRQGKLLHQLDPHDAHFIRQYAAQIQYKIEAVETTEPNHVNKTLSGSRVASQRCNFERADKFTLTGWAVDEDDKPAVFQVHINGNSVDCSITRQQRQDVADALGIFNLSTGFSIELPGYIWEQVPEAEDACIEILVNGRRLTPNPLELSRNQAVEWVSGIAQMAEGQEKQYFSLLALEHVRYGKLHEYLQEEAQIYFQLFSREMNLEDFVCFRDENALNKESIPTESTSTLLLWKAMRSLNFKLIEADIRDGVYNLVVDVLASHQLVGEARDWFLFLAAQLTCESGEFHKMRGVLDFEKLHHLSESELPQHITLALPALVADGYIDEAINALVRLRVSFKQGWLHTSCIRFAVDEVQRLESEGVIDVAKAERFRYAFIFLLDAFQGEWFSRLHDKELVCSMIRMIGDLSSCSDNMRRDMAAAAVRNYGFSPAFWEGIAVLNRAALPAEIVTGQEMWEEVRFIIQGWLPPSVNAAHIESVNATKELAARLIRPLLWFHRHGNLETVIILREVVMNSLPILGSNMGATNELLIEQLLAIDGAEALRIAAFPLALRNVSQMKFLETGEHLFDRLRELTDCKQSPVYDLQWSAAEALNKARDAADSITLSGALKEIGNISIYLSNPLGKFLGVDLLASCYVLAVKAGFDSDSFLMRLQESVRKAIAETGQDHYLPAPVQAALSRLQGFSADPLLAGFLRETNHALHGKLTGWHDEVLALPDEVALAVDGSGWPNDTLVAIFSARDRLSKAHPIRQAWLGDLDARGIPYIFVVEGNEDSLQADVLTLNVPAHQTNQIEKTLKLFEWAYRNTNAQYVLKIDDDCYLNVSRYFDTLSYRKHYYYGRVVHKEAGSFERWDQAKGDHHPGIRKSLDKSPEPSTYADSDGGYTLSRFAISRLLKEKASGVGSRLVLCSTKEDKLVGDLLAISGIRPSDEDYVIFEKHCTAAGAMPVGKGENTFYPCKDTPTKVVHLDTVHDLLQAREIAQGDELWPKKIWPTCYAPSVVCNSNQLELITEPGRIWPLLENKLAVVAVVRNEMVMLPHFLEHYRKLGVNCFIFADNCSDDGTREYLYEQPDTVLYSADTEYKLSHYGVTWQQAILGNLCLGKWVIVADADELMIYENCERKSLAEFVEEIESDGSDAALTHMIDMYPFGDLSDACFEKGAPFDVAPYFDSSAQIELKFGGGQFSNSKNFVSGLRHRIAPSRINSYVSQKYALFKYKPWMRLTEGIHYSANMKVSNRETFFAHFKYHAGFKSKVQAEIKRKQHFNGAEEYRSYANMLAEGQGRFGSEGLSVKYNDSSSFVSLIK